MIPIEIDIPKRKPDHEITLRVLSDEEIKPNVLAEFMYLFHAANAVGLKYLNDLPIKIEEQNLDISRARDFLIKKISQLSFAERSDLFDFDLGDNNPKIVRISKESPLTIVLCGCIPLILGALIIAGGRFKLLGVFEVELNALGDGIKKLRDAFAGGKEITTGYTIQNYVLYLNDEDFDYLKKKVKELKGRGGFQQYLKDVYRRVDRQTKSIELTPGDIDKVVRNIKEYGPGGFQDIYRKIFRKHLNLDGQLDMDLFEEN